MPIPRARYTGAERLRRLAAHEIWNIGIVDQPIWDIYRHGLTGRTRWLPTPPPGSMLADPSWQPQPGGGGTMYAEFLNYADGRGEIWSADIRAGGDLTAAQFKPFLQFGHHASYPFPFQDLNGRQLMTAETWQAGSAQLWGLGDEAESLGPLLPGRAVVDPTLWHGDGRWWLFCTLQDVDPDGALFLFHTEQLGDAWTPHPANPVQVGRVGSRPAGPLFRAGGRLVRPGQDCSSTYGGAVILFDVEILDEHRYRETPVRRIDPVPGRYSSGLHTIHAAGEQTLIDGKRWGVGVRSISRKLKRWLTLSSRSHISNKLQTCTAPNLW